MIKTLKNINPNEDNHPVIMLYEIANRRVKVLRRKKLSIKRKWGKLLKKKQNQKIFNISKFESCLFKD